MNQVETGGRHRCSAPPFAAGLLLLAFSAIGPSAAAGQRGQPTRQVVEAAPADPTLPSVRVIGLGGTITSSALGPSRWQSYGGDGFHIEEIIQRLMPDLSQVANVSSYELYNTGSSGLTAEHLHRATMKVDETLADPDIDGVVVTTGTNVMEEVAYWLDLTVRSEKPVVITGSMRQANTFSFDGLANLFNSITLAASGKTRCYGTVLLLNDEYVGAREVTKSDAVRTDTFTGGRFGVLGAVDERRVRAIHAPARVLDCGTAAWQTPFDLAQVGPDDIPRVEIVFSYLEAGPTAITAMVEDGVEGIVTAGHGAGGISHRTVLRPGRSDRRRRAHREGDAHRLGSRLDRRRGHHRGRRPDATEGEDPVAARARLQRRPSANPGVVRDDRAPGLRHVGALAQGSGGAITGRRWPRAHSLLPGTRDRRCRQSTLRSAPRHLRTRARGAEGVGPSAA